MSRDALRIRTQAFAPIFNSIFAVINEPSPSVKLTFRPFGPSDSVSISEAGKTGSFGSNTPALHQDRVDLPSGSHGKTDDHVKQAGELTCDIWREGSPLRRVPVIEEKPSGLPRVSTIRTLQSSLDRL